MIDFHIEGDPDSLNKLDAVPMTHHLLIGFHDGMYTVYKEKVNHLIYGNTYSMHDILNTLEIIPVLSISINDMPYEFNKLLQQHAYYIKHIPHPMHRYITEKLITGETK